jgi:hypothetical protein
MKRLLTFGTIVTLICATCVIANAKGEPETKITATPPQPVAAEMQRNEKLRADVLRLVNDAKAGKVKLPAQQFPQSTHRNNLSKGAKIAIGVSVAAVIVFAVLWHTTGPGSD